MIEEKKSFSLEGRGDSNSNSDARPVLTGVQASGRLDGVLFELTLRQTYRNASDRMLEVVYTFPLPNQAVLLGFASELNGERKVGTIVAKRDAERWYEEALTEGDAPVMLEALGDGLHTANIGNLKPGDEMVLEVRFAQLLAFEQGRLRLSIPTTIAPRYGSAEASGLQPQQVPQASLQAQYPLALSVTISGVLAGGVAECLTHRFARQALEGKLTMDLIPGAWMDRDVVVTVQPFEAWPSLVIQANDGASKEAPVVVMAALQPRQTTPRQNISLKLLVDCSGSMGGDSIASARRALQGVLAGLTERDHVSLSRFGSTVEHVAASTACTQHALRHLRSAVDAVDANLGGTEMEAALRAVFELPVPHCTAGADVLLVTDGEIWRGQEMIDAARASAHRVFVIGVGTSPAEGVLRSLAEATGGACEFVTPGEALEAAAARMLVRARQQPWRNARVDWGTETVWQTKVPTSVFGGDTLIAFAGVAGRRAAWAARLLAVDGSGATTELAWGEADAPSEGDTLSRMAAARRVATAGDADVRSMAVAYQLLSRQTNCILVHQRTGVDKATEEAELHRVGSMLAAGWGASATVMASASREYSALRTPSVWRRSRSPAASPDYFSVARADDFEIPAFVPEQSADAQPASLEALAAVVCEHLSHGGSVQGLAARCETLDLPAEARAALDRAVELGLSMANSWLMLAYWVNQRPGAAGDAALKEAMRPHLDGIGPDLLDQCLKLFDRALGACASDSGSLPRARRLKRALSRSQP